MKIEIVQAKSDDYETVLSILREVAKWLEDIGKPLWKHDELNEDFIRPHVEAGMYHLAKIGDEFAGCFRYQLEDKEYWDDVPHADSAFVHRVAVRRQFSGNNIAGQMIEFAKHKAKADGKKFLRLDCANRDKLRKLYEGFGFEFHSEKIKEPYMVIRYQFDLKNL